MRREETQKTDFPSKEFLCIWLLVIILVDHDGVWLYAKLGCMCLNPLTALYCREFCRVFASNYLVLGLQSRKSSHQWY
jgi:hypothetical protein